MLTSYFNLISADIKGVVKTVEGALPDVIVYIEKINGLQFSPPSSPVVMDQKDLTFIPHVLPILIGTTVVFPNSDITRHSVFSSAKIKKFDFGTYEQGSKKSLVFDKPGLVPLLCHVHPEMSAYIYVLETPYFAVTNESGRFIIKNVPAGRYKLSTWHEWAKPKTVEITVQSNKDFNIDFILEE
ncbi:MAG: methylamine utilization protein [Candidatus Kapabacteria bacterium]|nr:methylamine utilization protein [Candidatus Kapabacteria bacterium]